MPIENDELEQNLAQWAKALKSSTKHKFVKSYLVEFSKARLENSKLITGLLVIVGATASLMISNLGSIESVVELSLVKYGLVLLVLSGLAGLIGKNYEVCVRSCLSGMNNIEKKILECCSEHEEESDEIRETCGTVVHPPDTEFNLLESIDEITESMFWWNKRRVKKGVELGQKDALYGYKLILRYSEYQGVALFFQVLFFIAFVLYFAFSIF